MNLKGNSPVRQVQPAPRRVFLPEDFRYSDPLKGRVRRPGRHPGRESMSDIFKDRELEFPLSYDLKVIYTGAERSAEHLADLEGILEGLKIPHGQGRFRNSGQGRYVSISVPVKIADRPLFDLLYLRLKSCPEIKCAM